MAELERLQKFLARAGVGSRRACEDMIRKGLVQVDGDTVTELGFKIDPDKNVVFYEGKKVKLPKRHTYLLLNKPKGFVTTVRDEKGRQTVMDLVRTNASLKPVGRLDIDTEGLLLLTDDGELINKITHPKYGLAKTYRVSVKGDVASDKIDLLESGVYIENKRTAPAKAKIVSRNPKTTVIEITIKEGRKRQIRNMMMAIGHPVERLVRIKLGPLRLSGLAKGKYRRLTTEELESLKFDPLERKPKKSRD